MRRGQRRGSYTDVLCQGDHPLVTFDPWGGLEQRAGRGLALGQRPQVWEVCSLSAKLAGACGQTRVGQAGGRGLRRGPGWGCVPESRLCPLSRGAGPIPPPLAASVFRPARWGDCDPFLRAVLSGVRGGAWGGPTWLLVPQIPLQVALVELLEVLGEPLVEGQAGRAHGADGLHPVGAVAATVVTYSGQGPGSGWRQDPGLGLPLPAHPPMLAGAPRPEGGCGQMERGSEPEQGLLAGQRRGCVEKGERGNGGERDRRRRNTAGHASRQARRRSQT